MSGTTPGRPAIVIVRLLLALLLIVSAALLAFAAGTLLGGRYLVPPGQGLAAPAEAMGYGLIAALTAAAAAGFLAARLSRRALAVASLAAAVLVALALAWAWWEYHRRAGDTPPPDQPQTRAVTEPAGEDTA